MRALIVGVDPGPIPGVVVLALENGKNLVDPSVFQCDPGSALWVVTESLASEVVSWDVKMLAVERFVVGPRAARSSSAKSGATTRDLIGNLQAIGELAGARVHLRSAAEVKPWATDARLDTFGLMGATRGMPHARDGGRHALFSAVKDCGLPDPLSKRSPAPQQVRAV